MKNFTKLGAFIVLALSIFNLNATTITIGTGTIVNTTTSYPAPYGNWFWGARHQFLILASELNAAGMTAAGPINSLAFDVSTVNGVALQGFTIAMKHTATTNLTVFETGLTTVFTPLNYTETTGVNTHVFSTPFLWDGVSNIIVETCFNNNSFTNNAIVFQSATSFTSSIYRFADNITVCGSTAISGTSPNRPNMIFDWIAPNIPPVANFSASPTSSCTGVINFTDLSTQNPTAWNWNFGDGNTSTQPNPTHTYLTNGSFTVTLEACNAFGCDTLILNNLININTSIATPIAASCMPSTLTYCCGFGIANITFNTINNNSNDGVDGYSDFTCIQTTVFEGASYTLSIGSVAQSTQNYAAWIDFNNDGAFNNTTERIFTATSQMNASGNVIIPTGTTLNTPLRMRVSSDFDFSVAPTPCSNLDFGQAEDYTIIITQNLNPPVAAFTFAPNPSCSGTVCFTDQSQNAPTSWAWDFGDGVGTSVQPNPCYNFSADGVYNVTLVATNANGSNTIVIPVTITTANQVLAASCSPSTLAYCCGYGILNVNFNTITNPTPDGVEGYQDFSCSKQTTVTEGNTYSITISTGTSNAQDTRVWIDFNNDGVFNTTNEFVLDRPNAFNPTGNITIPGGTVLNTPLRMRISSDIVGIPQNGCTNNDFGQTEDYGIVILPNTLPPVANFSGTPTTTCSAPIQFTDLSTNAPTSWLWYFGDGTTSTLPNPSHTYANAGIYTVSLVVSNAFGQDSIAMINFITIVCPNTMPTTGVVTITDCNGTLFDDGWTANYSDNTDGVVVIQPVGATQITLNFVLFDFESGFDTLYIYDGATTSSPLIGGFSGTTLPPTITSSGGSITIRQRTDFVITEAGFQLNWLCSNTNNIPISGVINLSDCNGTLFDNGGNGLYSNNTDGAVVIQPANATQITLNFISFNFENNFDSLYVYDGLTTSSPLLGGFTGTTLPPSITSTGGGITIRQKTDGSIVRPGFELNWACSTVGIDENTASETDFIIYPNPTSSIINIETLTENNKISAIQLFNLVGQVVYQSTQFSNTSIITLDVSTYLKGIYFVHINTEKGSISKRVIIQ